MKAAVRAAAPHGPPGEHAFVFTLFLFVGARNGCITMRLFDQNQRAVARSVRPSVLHVSPNLRVRFVVVANGAERAG